MPEVPAGTKFVANIPELLAAAGCAGKDKKTNRPHHWARSMTAFQMARVAIELRRSGQNRSGKTERDPLAEDLLTCLLKGTEKEQ